MLIFPFFFTGVFDFYNALHTVYKIYHFICMTRKLVNLFSFFAMIMLGNRPRLHIDPLRSTQMIFGNHILYTIPDS
jgi:hypothetical protein